MNPKWEHALERKGPLGPLRYMVEHIVDFLPTKDPDDVTFIRQRLTSILVSLEIQTNWIIKEKADIESCCLRVQRLAETAKRVGVKSLINGDLTIVLGDE